ncbi:hypothetical protein [Desulfosporosinus sp. FKB]|uniref:hypothetical protein n=1 Tax=Desulfosporosinus sp. FKB TaxID=1969835 RepID=UPI000B4A3B93|nr:hypothetical protein [Desulfosporosinus sp. FKB]
MKWMLDNKEWLFSGIGVVICGYILKYFIKNKQEKTFSQKSGHHSNNYQCSESININSSINNDRGIHK